ncbi:MAG TPA: hypothetical protein VHC19_16110 [Pirellulales bacterium]|nr:hypothetical protein [Pirellulales bacterium]
MTQARSAQDREAAARAAIEELVRRARTGDESVAEHLQWILDRHPEIWHQLGDLAGHAEQTWLKLYAGKDLAIKASAARKLTALRTDLLGVFPSPLERLLVDRIVVSWLRVAHLTLAAGLPNEMPPGQRELIERRLERAEKQHVAAIRSLAVLRKVEASTTPRGNSTAAQLEPESAAEPIAGRSRPPTASGSKPRGKKGREPMSARKSERNNLDPLLNQTSGANRLRAFVAADEPLQ